MNKTQTDSIGDNLMSNPNITASTALAQVAGRLAMTEAEAHDVIMQTVMPNQNVTQAQFATFIAVAAEYRLNPLTKEVYAYPKQGGGIQPIVSIDGWLKIINTHPDFNGMTFNDERDESGKLTAITCNIHKKGIEHPVQVTEYMAECMMGTQPWKKYPARMLRHKAAIQAGRYAFGLSGIIDPDEADRYKDAGVIETDEKTINTLSDEQFAEQFPRWKSAIEGGMKTHAEVIEYIAGKGFVLTGDQMEIINTVEVAKEGANDE